MSKVIVITGAGGILCSDFARHLAKMGHQRRCPAPQIFGTESAVHLLAGCLSDSLRCSRYYVAYYGGLL